MLLASVKRNGASALGVKMIDLLDLTEDQKYVVPRKEEL